MRILVSAVFTCSIIALILVAGCTDILIKQKAGGFGEVSTTTGTGGISGYVTVPGSTLTTAPVTHVTTGGAQEGTTDTATAVSQGSCGPGLTQCQVFGTNYCIDLNTDPKHCGKCRSACYLRDAENGCSGGKCYVKSCKIGWANCNGLDADGCEIDLDSDSKNCGACGRVCKLPNANAICAGEDGDGRCEVEWCESGWNNSNGIQEDGCEYYNT